MTGHTAKGWPYALPTDALIDYPAASLELANKAGNAQGWSTLWVPTGADVASGNFAAAQGILEITDANSVKARINFTPPVAGTFTYEFQTVLQQLDASWQRCDQRVQICRASDSVQLAVEAKSIMYATMAGPSFAAVGCKNSVAVAAGVPIFGTAFVEALSGTWRWWMGSSYLRAFASFTPT